MVASERIEHGYGPKHLNPGPPEYETRLLATQPQRSVIIVVVVVVVVIITLEYICPNTMAQDL
jgi:hypothetical protein